MPCDGQRAAIMYVGHNCELEPNYPPVGSYTLTHVRKNACESAADMWMHGLGSGQASTNVKKLHATTSSSFFEVQVQQQLWCVPKAN